MLHITVASGLCPQLACVSCIFFFALSKCSFGRCISRMCMNTIMLLFVKQAGQIHPVLMLIGFIILGGEAIISYKSLPLKKDVKKIIHLVLHAIALILGIIGVWAAFKFHNESGILNLYSLHSWLGIGTISLYGIQWIYGFVVFFYPGGNASIRSESLPWHVLVGIFVYALAIATAAIGFLEKLTFLQNAGLDKFGSEAFLVNFTAIATILFGAFVLLTVYAQKDQEEEDYAGSYSAI